MSRDVTMEITVSQSRPPRRFPIHRGRFLAAFVLAAVLLIVAHALITSQTDSITVAGLFLSLPLMLIAALGAGRGLLTPSLKELAFYFFAIMAAGVIWPGANLAISTYKDAGFMALAAFMIFVFTLAVALAVLSAYLLAGQDEER
jgi:hypothetical protein